LEDILCEYTAGKVALNFIPDARTALDNAVTAYGLANTQVDLITARAGQIVTDCGTARTAASASFSTATTVLGKAETSLNTDAEAALDKMNGDIEIGLGADGATLLAIIDDVNTEVDQSIKDTDDKRTAFTDQIATIDTAITAIGTAITGAGTYISSGDDYINTVPVGNLPENAYLNYSVSQINVLNANVKKIQAALEESKAYDPIIANVLNGARGFLNEVSARMSVEAQLTTESLQEARERIRLAYGSIAEAKGYIEADYRKVVNLINVITGEARAISSYSTQASGYFQEANTSIRLAQAVTAMTKWAEGKIAMALADLRRQTPNVRIRYASI